MTSPATEHREACTLCFKPRLTCVCARVPRIATRTKVTVLQHPRERFHPFGTARFVELGLPNARVEVCFGMRCDTLQISASDDVALLYPARDARDLGSLSPAERPRHLVVLDGTWAHAHVMHRDLPGLRELPHVALFPESPGRYRIRREPRPECLSTVEAVVQALGVLEPDTSGLHRLLAAFDVMIDEQIELMRARRAGRRRRGRPVREGRAIPRTLATGLDYLVIAYGESSARDVGAPRGPRDPLQWVAARAATLETFEGFARPTERLPSARHLEHMGLDASAFHAAGDLAELGRRWRAFLGPDDVVGAWNQSSLDIAERLAPGRRTVLLKSAYCNERGGSSGTLDDVVARECLAPPRLTIRGRAARRLANAVAITRWLSGRAAG